MKIFVIAVALVSLSIGCVTEETVYDKLHSWRGEDADNLVKRWGAPDRTYDNADGSKTLTYEEVDSKDSSRKSKDSRCTVNVNVDAENTIASLVWRGNTRKCNRYVSPNPDQEFSH